MTNGPKDKKPDAFDVERFLSENGIKPDSDKPGDQGNPPQSRARTWDAPGFDGRARVTTNFGDLPIMGLRLRDRVKTTSGEYKPVQWIDELRLDEAFLTGFPEAQPVRIGKGALANNCPETDLLLSPAQELLLKKEWNQSETKIAGDLLQRPNVFHMRVPSMTYYLFHCGEADVVLVEGIWCRVAPR